MARYIDADAFIRILDAKADMAMGTVKEVFLSVAKMVDYLPHSDVAPKSEVAREIFEGLYKSVASKIPMEIRPIFKDDGDFDGGFINGKIDALLDVLVLIAELKKKYTEEKE